jgi:hypothetical protein
VSPQLALSRRLIVRVFVSYTGRPAGSDDAWKHVLRQVEDAWKSILHRHLVDHHRPSTVRRDLFPSRAVVIGPGELAAFASSPPSELGARSESTRRLSELLLSSPTPALPPPLCALRSRPQLIKSANVGKDLLSTSIKKFPRQQWTQVQKFLRQQWTQVQWYLRCRGVKHLLQNARLNTNLAFVRRRDASHNNRERPFQPDSDSGANQTASTLLPWGDYIMGIHSSVAVLAGAEKSEQVSRGPRLGGTVD